MRGRTVVFHFDWGEIKKMMLDGVRNPDIAYTLDCSLTTLVCRCKKENGISIRQFKKEAIRAALGHTRVILKGTRMPLDWDKVDRMLIDGQRTAKIVASLKILRDKFYYRCRSEMGVTFLKYKEKVLRDYEAHIE